MKRTQEEIERMTEDTLRMFNNKTDYSGFINWANLEASLDAKHQPLYRSSILTLSGLLLLILLNIGTLVEHRFSILIDIPETELIDFENEYQLNDDESPFN